MRNKNKLLGLAMLIGCSKGEHRDYNEKQSTFKARQEQAAIQITKTLFRSTPVEIGNELSYEIVEQDEDHALVRFAGDAGMNFCANMEQFNAFVVDHGGFVTNDGVFEGKISFHYVETRYPFYRPAQNWCQAIAADTTYDFPMMFDRQVAGQWRIIVLEHNMFERFQIVVTYTEETKEWSVSITELKQE